MNVVIDTNVMIESITSRSPYHNIFVHLLENKFFILITNEIITEYFEVFSQIYSKDLIQEIENFFLYSSSVVRVDPHYHFPVIEADPDDNKFVDCAVCGNADFLVTSDKHFGILRGILFPKVPIISPEEFIEKHLRE
jgi:putative PIN family toxin of toxin-antitoxin system